MVMSRQLFALGLSVILLAACGKQGPAADSAPATSESAAPASASPATTAPASAAPTRTTPADKSTPVTRSARLNEDGSETIEESTGDTGAHNPLLAAVATSAAAATTEPTSVWKEGVNYNRLVPAQPTSAGPDQVEVLEVFWYGCGHCFHLDPALESWRRTGKPAYVDFVRAHVMWNHTQAHAKLYYTVKALGRLEDLHAEVFRQIHVNGDYLAAADAAATERLQRAFLTSKGVSDAAFDSAYRSFAVDNDLRQAEDLTRRYKVSGVPLLIVNGKYSTDVGLAGGEAELIELLNYLAATEHKR